MKSGPPYLRQFWCGVKSCLLVLAVTTLFKMGGYGTSTTVSTAYGARQSRWNSSAGVTTNQVWPRDLDGDGEAHSILTDHFWEVAVVEGLSLLLAGAGIGIGVLFLWLAWGWWKHWTRS